MRLPISCPRCKRNEWLEVKSKAIAWNKERERRRWAKLKDVYLVLRTEKIRQLRRAWNECFN